MTGQGSNNRERIDRSGAPSQDHGTATGGNTSVHERLDVALVRRGLVATRARARDLVRRGEVSVNGAVATKPAQAVAASHVLEVAEGAGGWVSRGALKLLAALERFSIDPAGRVCLDVGASTGGFTQVLLERGATRVYAIENGRDQLAGMLASDPRVVSLEKTDARALTAAQIPEPIGLIVADLSFISLLKVLPAVLEFADQQAAMVALIKPQFESEPGAVGKDGIVRDERVRHRAVAAVEAWVAAQPGWRGLGVMPSPIAGGSGNLEFLIGAVRHG